MRPAPRFAIATCLEVAVHAPAGPRLMAPARSNERKPDAATQEAAATAAATNATATIAPAIAAAVAAAIAATLGHCLVGTQGQRHSAEPERAKAVKRKQRTRRNNTRHDLAECRTR